MELCSFLLIQAVEVPAEVEATNTYKTIRPLHLHQTHYFPSSCSDHRKAIHRAGLSLVKDQIRTMNVAVHVAWLYYYMGKLVSY